VEKNFNLESEFRIFFWGGGIERIEGAKERLYN